MCKTAYPRLPIGVMLIAAFYIFGAAMLLVALFTNPAGASRTIADAHGLSPMADAFVLPIVAGMALLIGYGLLTLSRWGYFLTVFYLLGFGSINIWLMSQSVQQPYIGNTTWALLVFAYLAARRDIFLKITDRPIEE